MLMFVLECDDSQTNILDDNDWKKSPPPAPWTESLTCAGTGDTTVYRGTKRKTHFKNMLPGTVMFKITPLFKVSVWLGMIVELRMQNCRECYKQRYYIYI